MGRCAMRLGRRTHRSFSSCVVQCARAGLSALAFVAVLRGLVGLWVPSGRVPAELWLVGCQTVASLGLGSEHAVWLTLVLARSSLAVLRACHGLGPKSSFQGACETLGHAW